MDFTLDSVAHAVAVLEKKFKRKVIKTPVFYDDLYTLINPRGNFYFFGVITFGDVLYLSTDYQDVSTVYGGSRIYHLQEQVNSFTLHNDNSYRSFLEADVNSQLVSLFRKIEPNFTQPSSLNIITYNDFDRLRGQFRGFLLEISIDGLPKDYLL